jgi:DNA adenine methylase
MTATVPGRPVLRYHGGKWRSARWIINHLPPHSTYVEPFAGAASVLMQKRRSNSEVINDLNKDVVGLFRVLRNPKQADELERLLRLTPFARNEFFDAYEVADDPVESARRLLIRSFMGHGSAACNPQHKTGFRNDCTRSYTTPATDWANFPAHLKRMTARLAGVVVENRTAMDLLTMFDTVDTCFYCDPPYVFATRRSVGRKNHLYEHEMTDEDHRELAEALHKVEGMVVLSGYRSDLYLELYPNWTFVESIAYADGRSPRVEVLWFNPAAATRMQQTLPFADGEEE